MQYTSHCSKNRFALVLIGPSPRVVKNKTIVRSDITAAVLIPTYRSKMTDTLRDTDYRSISF
jgi:hypothetical protein